VNRIPRNNLLDVFEQNPLRAASFRKTAKRTKRILPVVALLVLLSTSLSWRVLAAPTMMKVDPPSYLVSGGDIFRANITVVDVVGCAGWEFKLYYKRSVLNCSAIAEGPFLKGVGETFTVFQINNTWSTAFGRILAACSLLGYGVSASGTGVLATITFKALGSGDSALDLVDTKLAGSGDPPPPIPHTSADGAVHVSALMKVDPPSFSVNLGDSFRVNVSVVCVSNLAGWEFKLYFKRSILECLAIDEGPFLKNVGQTFHIFQIDNAYNATHGRVFPACTLLGFNVSASGSGVLVSMTFSAIDYGDTGLDLVDTKLAAQGDPPPSIPHTSASGIVHVLPPAHDLAIVSVNPLKSVVGKGYPCKIEVTARNKGAYLETFDLAIFANTTQIASYTIMELDPDSQITVTFTWSTTNYIKAKYSISAFIQPVPGELNTSDNTLIDSWVLVSIPGDVTGDRTVNVLDLILIANHLSHTSGNGHVRFSKTWYDCTNTDVNADNTHNVLDLIVAANNIGQRWS